MYSRMEGRYLNEGHPAGLGVILGYECFTRFCLYNSDVIVCQGDHNIIGDFSIQDLYLILLSEISQLDYQYNSTLGISLDVPSLLLMFGGVAGQSRQMILPDVVSIILMYDCVPGQSELVILPDVVSIILIVYQVSRNW